MNHKVRHKKLNRTSSHRKSMLANMASSLIMNEQIRTTLPKAKTLRPYVEKLVTLAKNSAGNSGKELSARRNIISNIRDELAANKLLSTLGVRYKKRLGGYTRIIKAGFRYGDLSPMAYIEFVDRDINAKGCMTPVKESDDSDQKLIESKN